MNPDLLDEDAFTIFLNSMEYDEIEAIYLRVDTYHQVLILRHCARLISAYIERKNTLTTIHEIKEYVRLLPIYLDREKRLRQLVNNQGKPVS